MNEYPLEIQEYLCKLRNDIREVRESWISRISEIPDDLSTKFFNEMHYIADLIYKLEIYPYITKKEVNKDERS